MTNSEQILEAGTKVYYATNEFFTRERKMPTPDDKDWDELTDYEKANLEQWEYDLYLEVKEEEFREIARETMAEEMQEVQKKLKTKSEITVRVPKQLAQFFITLAKEVRRSMGDSNSNDFEVDDTPENRELIDHAAANSFGMTLEEYRDKHIEHHVHKGNKLITCDYFLFNLFVKMVNDSIEATDDR